MHPQGMVIVSSLLSEGLPANVNFNMFKLFLVIVLLGLVAADQNDKDAEIRSIKNEAPDAEGNFAFGFEASNGISIQENGNAAGASGAAQWISPEGIPIQLRYTADEDGFHPAGDHLPTPPPIPEAILKAIEYIRVHLPKE